MQKAYMTSLASRKTNSTIINNDTKHLHDESGDERKHESGDAANSGTAGKHDAARELEIHLNAAHVNAEHYDLGSGRRER